MRRIFLVTGIILVIICQAFTHTEQEQNWIRINQLGYTTGGIKVAVWCSKENKLPESVDLIDASTQQIVYTVKNLQAFGSYGPFNQSARIRFTSFYHKHTLPAIFDITVLTVLHRFFHTLWMPMQMHSQISLL